VPLVELLDFPLPEPAGAPPGPPPPGPPAHNGSTPYSPTTDSCAGCHRAHAAQDSYLNSRGTEEGLCLMCHDGTGAHTNVADEFQLPYRHPVEETQGIHRAEEIHPDRFQPPNRHVECVDCHNPHELASGGHPQGANYAGNTLQGTWGIRRDGQGLSPVLAVLYEYELCYKCHSSWSSVGSGTDVAAEFNPANLSHHAVEAPGRNQPGSANPSFDSTFVPPWSAASTLACSDCHGETGTPGVHGSTRPWLLRGNETGQGSPEVLCYNCHRREVYGDVDLPDPPYQDLSRFRHPGEEDHTQTQGPWGTNPWGIWCMNCHGGDTLGGIHGTNAGVGPYGETPLGARMMNGAFVQGWTAASGGRMGSCWATCHQGGGRKHYRANYDYPP